MTTYLYDFEIGTESDNLVNVESLGSATEPLPAPVWRYVPYSEAVDTEDGNLVALGLPSVVWKFPELTRTQRTALRAFIAGPSATVYIKTKSNENADEYVYLTGKAIWPRDEEVESAGRRLNFEIMFIQMEAFTP
jgi:hypothetical protein